MQKKNEVAAKLQADLETVMTYVTSLKARKDQPILPADLDPIEHALKGAITDCTRVTPLLKA